MDSNEYEQKVVLMDQWAETLRAQMVPIISDSFPESIYHYTDINGLMGLLSSGCIWATHVNRLNDLSENKLGFNIVISHIQDNPPESSRPLINKAILELQSVDTYVACYSSERDLLSQWRNYTGSQVGYSIGFDARKMATQDDKIPILEKVIYQEDTAKALIDLLLRRVDDFLIQDTFDALEVGFILGTVESLLNIIACIIKHPKFEEEREYRHIYQPGKTRLDLPVYFKAGQYGLTPYVAINFLEKGRLPITTITVGPCHDFELEYKVLSLFLHNNGYKDVEILHSEIPLRV
jgi:hypothetical protein